MEQRIAIVTTLKHAPAPVLKTFLEYHFAIGFDHIFLFFDDPKDPAIEEAAKYADVSIYKNDQDLHRLWMATKLYHSRQEYLSFLNVEVMARQVINVEVAIAEGLKHGIDWLLHIDIDELFYSPCESVHDHYKDLTNKDVRIIRYANHEAIPEKDDVANYFQEVTLFKKNEAALNEEQKEILRKEVQHHRPYFNFYSCGKSAARMQPGDLPVPATVHEFFDGDLYVHNPIILHFPCCGFENFWSKYVILGNFANKWFGQYDIEKTLPVHLEARDVVSNNDHEIGKQFYRTVIMKPDRDEVARLLENGIYLRVNLDDYWKQAVW